MATYDYEAMFGPAARRECKRITDRIVEEIHLILRPGYGYRSGELSRGYESRETLHGAEVVQTEADYWKYVEYGTKEMAAEPHIRPAIEIVRKELL